MPADRKLFGDRPPTPDGRKVAAVPTSKNAPAPIARDRYFRIGKAPDASATSAMRGAMNHAMIHRTPQAFGYVGILGDGTGIGVGSVAGTLKRWRFAFKTTPYHHLLVVRAFLFPHNRATAPTANAFARLKIFSDTAEATLVSTTDFYYGGSTIDTGAQAGWSYMKLVTLQVDGLSADTWYSALVTDEAYGLIQSISAADMQSMTENYNGYLATNYTQESFILDTDRSTLLTPMPSLWKRGGAKVLDFTVNVQDGGVRTTNSATPKNLIDNTSTTYGSSIPGFTFDMTGKARLSQSTGVPCKLSVFALSSANAGKGRFNLRDSSGTSIAAITGGWSTTSGSWVSTTVTLPATSAKYYLTWDADVAPVGEFWFYAVSIWEEE